MKEESTQKPTIENPFERPIKKAPPVLPHKPTSEQPKLYLPAYFVSTASKMFIDEQLAQGTITADGLKDLHQLAKIISNLFRRVSPTLSDIEAAVTFRNLDNVRKVAAGEEHIDILQFNPKTMQMLPKKERLAFWQSMAVQIITEIDKDQQSSSG